MRNWLAVGVVGVVSAMVTAFAAGCSSAAPVTVSEFCTQKATEECRFVQPVCSELVTSAACIAARTTLCNTDAENATSTGRVFNPNNIPACIDAIDSTYGVLSPGANQQLAYAGISGTATDQSTVDYLCESVFQGNIGMNQPCTSAYDCQSPLACTPSAGGSKVNVCAPLNNVGDGQPCGAAGDICVSGDTCVPNKKTGEYLCEPSTSQLAEQGQACTVDSSGGSNCDPTSAGLCDIYPLKGSHPVCETYYEFGYGNDCQYFGGSAPN